MIVLLNRFYSVPNYLYSKKFSFLTKQKRGCLKSEAAFFYEKGKPWLKCQYVELVFAELKHNKNFKRFMLLGKNKVEVDIGILAIAHNMKKIKKAA
ncbi:transposase [Chryseobacterium arachidis]|uniref:transposase n=1 Tax=Chryseobacterium arachidis TaxID=1416778 RepID=UPI0009FB36DF